MLCVNAVSPEMTLSFMLKVIMKFHSEVLLLTFVVLLLNEDAVICFFMSVLLFVNTVVSLL